MVLDANTGKAVPGIPGQKRNHGVAIVPSAGRGFITDGAGVNATKLDGDVFVSCGVSVLKLAFQQRCIKTGLWPIPPR